jgi:hypothetical protein
VTSRDWVEWHRQYDDPASHLSRRLALVKGHLREALDSAPPGDLRLISMCAGEGRDVIPVLTEHRRRGDVTARLVERDERNVATARASAAGLGLEKVEVVCDDAGMIGSYDGGVPAHILLACGVFGNISAEDVVNTVNNLPALCEPGAMVIWTRHRRSPDLTPAIRGWFEEAGFAEIAFEEPEELSVGVGVHRLVADPHRGHTADRLFRFLSDT